MPPEPSPTRPPQRTDASNGLGFGVGLRSPHYSAVLERARERALRIDWFEVISENFMIPGGKPLRILDEVRVHAPVVLHGVSMNIGSTDPLDGEYLDALARLVNRFEPSWISDHLCWTGVGRHNLHDLMPLPYCEAAIDHVADRIARVQDRLQQRIAIENVSSYLSYVTDEMSEWEFLIAIAQRADCRILLDVNNVFVSAHNHGFDAATYIDAIPKDRVCQIHLAGHSESGPLLIDTHDHPVCDDVWALYERATQRLGRVPTLIEWDDRIPEFDVLEQQALIARKRCDEALSSGGPGVSIRRAG